MSRELLTFALAFAVATLISAGRVEAQGPRRAPVQQGLYSPAPTLSPYLDYFRRPDGPLDSYHQFVRPKIQLERTLRRQAAESWTQQQEIRTLGGQLNQVQRTGSLAPTGVGATYFNYSHFYPGKR